MGGLHDALSEAVEHLLQHHPVQQIGTGRAAVRQRLRDWLDADRQLPPEQRKHRTLSRQQYLDLCAEAGNVSDPDALLDFLHLTGVVYHRPGQFDDRIILDQSWALDAIYTVLHRNRVLPGLIEDGKFTRRKLAHLAWQDRSETDQRVLLDMMESCGICFRLLNLSNDLHNPDWQYAAPDLLPEWEEARRRLLFGRLQDRPPDAAAQAQYRFLHDGILRTLLSKIGQEAGEAGVFWKYGCWFGEATTRSFILVRSTRAPSDGSSTAGEVTLESWGDRADALLDRVLQKLLAIPLGSQPTVQRSGTAPTPRPEREPEPLRIAAPALGLPGKASKSSSPTPGARTRPPRDASTNNASTNCATSSSPGVISRSTTRNTCDRAS